MVTTRLLPLGHWALRPPSDLSSPSARSPTYSLPPDHSVRTPILSPLRSPFPLSLPPPRVTYTKVPLPSLTPPLHSPNAPPPLTAHLSPDSLPSPRVPAPQPSEKTPCPVFLLPRSYSCRSTSAHIPSLCPAIADEGQIVSPMTDYSHHAALPVSKRRPPSPPAGTMNVFQWGRLVCVHPSVAGSDDCESSTSSRPSV